jgi:hypothetical protein
MASANVRLPMNTFTHVETYEVEEIFAGEVKFRFMEKGEREGEDVYMALGQTEPGRYLTVFLLCDSL